jgi:pyridoxamine 5'-phosphate oxidase
LDHGFIFYSNYRSPKGQDLEDNPRAELLFYWPELERQVRVAGPVEKVSRQESEVYFRSRPRGNQVGASVSPQGEVIASREALEQQFAAFEAQIGEGQVPMPEHWGGFRVVPESVEFWQGRVSRLHDRLKYVRTSEGAWTVVRLAP